jgi:hypothetical protein
MAKIITQTNPLKAVLKGEQEKVKTGVAPADKADQ